MNRSQDTTPLIEEWLSDGPDVAPDRLLTEITARVGSTRQEGSVPMNRFGRVGVAAAAAVAVAVVVVIGILVSRGDTHFGPAQSASPTTTARIRVTDVLAYVVGGNLWVAAADGSGARQLTTGGGIDGGIDWSPDGARLAFIGGGGLLQILDADGTIHLVTNEAGLRWPSWSPDGTQIVVVRAIAGGQRDALGNALGIVNVDDGRIVPVPRAIGCMYDPDWGGRGEIAFTGKQDCSQGDEPSGIYTIRPDGSNLQEVVGPGAQNNSAAWGPGGTSIAFQTDEGGGCIFVVDSDGGNARQITQSCSQIFKLTWSSDGSRIAWAGGSRGPASASSIAVEEHGLPPFNDIGSVSFLDWSPVAFL
jgi:Tol biopolymer transport system component